VRPDDNELLTLLTQFERVRITDFKAVDMNRFQFDYDLTFAILMMDADGGVLARYGSQDWRSSSARVSIAGLKKAMQEVLDLHRAGDRGVKPPRAGAPVTVADIPAYAESKAAKEECAHCHYANNFRFKQRMREGRFTKEMLFQYPLPENIGIELDVDRNNVVKTVLPASAAEKAGVKPGDIVTRINAARVLTPADLQTVLNELPDPASVDLTLVRRGQEIPPVTLSLGKGWRRTDISWRPSQDVVPPTVGIWAEALKEDQARIRGIPPGKLALRVSFFFPGPAWAKSRGDLKMDDVIVGVDQKELPAMTTRQFHSWFRLNHEVGDKVTLHVLRNRQRMDVRVECIDPEEG
jgi:serine protease Do